MATYLLHQHGLVSEGALGLRARRGQRLAELGLRVHAPHPLAAAARDRLDQHRPADARGLLREPHVGLVDAVVARHDRHARLLHQPLGLALEPHRADGSRRGPHEDEPRGLHRLDEGGVLRQEPVARMDRLGAGGQCRLHDPVDPQVAVGGRGRADAHGLVAGRDMGGSCVYVREDGDGADPEAPGGARDPDGDLAAVGDEEGGEHQGASPSQGRSRKRRRAAWDITRTSPTRSSIRRSSSIKAKTKVFGSNRPRTSSLRNPMRCASAREPSMPRPNVWFADSIAHLSSHSSKWAMWFRTARFFSNELPLTSNSARRKTARKLAMWAAFPARAVGKKIRLIRAESESTRRMAA